MINGSSSVLNIGKIFCELAALNSPSDVTNSCSSVKSLKPITFPDATRTRYFVDDLRCVSVYSVGKK